MENTMIRIHKDGKGMYVAAPPMSPLHFMRNSENRHPLPTRDSLLVQNAFHLYEIVMYEGEERIFWNGPEFIFGFRNYEQMRSWLYEDSVLDHLHECDMVVSILQGQVYHGHTQSVIHERTAITLETLSIPEFLARHA